MSADHDFLAEVYGARELTRQERGVVLATQIRESSQQIAACEASQLHRVAEFVAEIRAEAVAELASHPRVSGQPDDEEVIRTAVHGELQALLGISATHAARMVDLAQRLITTLPETLDALQDGRLDLTRARALSDATEILPDHLARQVQDQVLGAAGEAPWDGLSPRAWRGRIERAVVRADTEAARKRNEQAYEERSVRSLPSIGGMADLYVSGRAEDVAMAMQVITDLAHGLPKTGADGEYITMDQRRADAFVDLFRRVRDGDDLPRVPVRRERELGLVMHVDTLFGDGPAARDPGEVRGLGEDSAVDPVTAREQGQGAARTGATNVLLVDRAGVLTRVVRVPKAPAGGWTRQLLKAAVTARLDSLPPLRCETYAPTVAIEDHVRARNPRCTGYDCPRRARGCDLDHDTPWPRGPTDAINLGPRCPRQHEIKTRGLVRTRLHPDGSVDTIGLFGLVITTRPEPLPGFAPGEGYARRGTSQTTEDCGTST